MNAFFSSIEHYNGIMTAYSSVKSIYVYPLMPLQMSLDSTLSLCTNCEVTAYCLQCSIDKHSQSTLTMFCCSMWQHYALVILVITSYMYVYVYICMYICICMYI